MLSEFNFKNPFYVLLLGNITKAVSDLDLFEFVVTD